MPRWEIQTADGQRREISADAIAAIEDGKILMFYNHSADPSSGPSVIAELTNGPGLLITETAD
jgi:hypothetical protein